MKSGSATKPFWGIKPELTEKTKGNLLITLPWPALMRTVYNNHPRFIEVYLCLHRVLTLPVMVRNVMPMDILIEQTAKIIGPIAKPDIIQFAVALPKTRSGKIMRRLLRKIASGETQDFGDVSTLADPKVIEELLKEHAASKQP